LRQLGRFPNYNTGLAADHRSNQAA
jgi:hypothetical protein